MKQTVRVLIEGKHGVEWYASYDVDPKNLIIAVDGKSINIDATAPVNLFTSNDVYFVNVDLARELYETYVLASGGLTHRGDPCPVWNSLPAETRHSWLAVARRATTLGALYTKPTQRSKVPTHDTVAFLEDHGAAVRDFDLESNE